MVQGEKGFIIGHTSKGPQGDLGPLQTGGAVKTQPQTREDSASCALEAHPTSTGKKKRRTHRDLG